MKKKMVEIRKKVVAILCGVAIGTSLVGCGNKQIIDTVRTFDTAIINLQGDVITINVKSWADYDGEQLQIIATNGDVYLVNSVNCTLIRRKK